MSEMSLTDRIVALAVRTAAVRDGETAESWADRCRLDPGETTDIVFADLKVHGAVCDPEHDIVRAEHFDGFRARVMAASISKGDIATGVSLDVVVESGEPRVTRVDRIGGR